MEGRERRMGPFRWIANTIAEKIADILLGGDVLAPGRDGTDVDWGALEEKMVQSLKAVLPRIQLDLALLAADRKTDGKLDQKEVSRLISMAPGLGDDEELECDLAEDCHLRFAGSGEKDLELELTGKGPLFQILRHEFWDRGRELEMVAEDKKARPKNEDGP